VKARNRTAKVHRANEFIVLSMFVQEYEVAPITLCRRDFA
jgi:hypothetical protein